MKKLNLRGEVPLVFEQLEKLLDDDLTFSVQSLQSLLKDVTLETEPEKIVRLKVPKMVLLNQGNGRLECGPVRYMTGNPNADLLLDLFLLEGGLEIKGSLVEEMYNNFSTECYHYPGVSEISENFVLLSFFNNLLSKFIQEKLAQSTFKLIAKPRVPDFPETDAHLYHLHFGNTARLRYPIELVRMEHLIGSWITQYYEFRNFVHFKKGYLNYGDRTFLDEAHLALLTELLEIDSDKLRQISLILEGEIVEEPATFVKLKSIPASKIQEIKSVIGLDSLTLRGKTLDFNLRESMDDSPYLEMIRDFILSKLDRR